MNPEVAMWVGGFLIIGSYGIIGAAFGLLLYSLRRLADKADGHRELLVDHGERLVHLETLGEAQVEIAARMVHSPHTPIIDGYIDKYLDRNYELSPKEWEELLGLSESSAKENAGTDKGSFARMVAATCHHKLRHEPPNKPEADT